MFAIKKKLSGDVIIGLGAIALALVFIIVAKGMKFFLSDTDPGPIVFPIGAALAVIVLSLVLIVKSLCNPKEYLKGVFTDPEQKASFLRMLMMLGAMALFLVLWNVVPFLVACIPFTFALCMLFRQSLRFSIIYSLALSGIVYVVFVMILQVRLDIF